MTGRRAETDRYKEMVVHHLLCYWKANPELRLGQMLTLATMDTDDLFTIEDFDLLTALYDTEGIHTP